MSGDSLTGVFCPSCRTDDTKVVDSRIAEEGSAIRRRRECLACAHRFTTFERVDHAPLTVVKSHGGDEPFDRAKVIGGLAAATKGRNVSEPSSTRSRHVSRSACASGLDRHQRAVGRCGARPVALGRRCRVPAIRERLQGLRRRVATSTGSWRCSRSQPRRRSQRANRNDRSSIANWARLEAVRKVVGAGGETWARTADRHR